MDAAQVMAWTEFVCLEIFAQALFLLICPTAPACLLPPAGVGTWPGPGYHYSSCPVAGQRTIPGKQRQVPTTGERQNQLGILFSYGTFQTNKKVEQHNELYISIAQLQQ